jgi:hypothetical protein
MPTKQHFIPSTTDSKRPVKPELKLKMKRLRHLLTKQSIAALKTARTAGPQATP